MISSVSSSALQSSDPAPAASNQNEQDSFLSFNLTAAIAEAETFCAEFAATMQIGANGVTAVTQPKWARQMVHRRGVVDAVIDKIGSNSFAKRRPKETADYNAYVKKRYEAGEALLFRIPVGPVKNMIRHSGPQMPDIAEYLMFVQLARFAAAIAPLYPHGVKIQIVPDDVRARAANLCPDDYVASYIGGLRRLVDAMTFSEWLQVEDGQMRLCDLYKVARYREAAETKLLDWKANEPESFTSRWEAALENARKNFPVEQSDDSEAEIAASAWRYMVAHQSEILSGMWSPVDAFPMVYANHPNCYQLFSMGAKKTKLPWQISLPVDLLDAAQVPACLQSL